MDFFTTIHRLLLKERRLNKDWCPQDGVIGSDSRLSTMWAARSLIITTAALQHLDTPTESRDQAEATPVELRYLHPSLTYVSSIQNKKHHRDEQTTAPVHKIQPCWLCQHTHSNVKTAELTFLLAFLYKFMTLGLLFLPVMWALLRYL